MQKNCGNHPDSRAVTACSVCAKPLCLMCVEEKAEGTFCSDSCADARRLQMRAQAAVADAPPGLCAKHPESPSVARCKVCEKGACLLCIIETPEGTFCSAQCLEVLSEVKGWVDDPPEPPRREPQPRVPPHREEPARRSAGPEGREGAPLAPPDASPASPEPAAVPARSGTGRIVAVLLATAALVVIAVVAIRESAKPPAPPERGVTAKEPPRAESPKPDPKPDLAPPKSPPNPPVVAKPESPAGAKEGQPKPPPPPEPPKPNPDPVVARPEPPKPKPDLSSETKPAPVVAKPEAPKREPPKADSAPVAKPEPPKPPEPVKPQPDSPVVAKPTPPADRAKPPADAAPRPAPARHLLRAADPWVDVRPGAWYRVKRTEGGQDTFTDFGLKERGGWYTVVASQSRRAKEEPEQHRWVEVAEARSTGDLKLEQIDVDLVSLAGRERDVLWVVREGVHAGVVLKQESTGRRVQIAKVEPDRLTVKDRSFSCLRVEEDGGARVRRWLSAEVPLAIRTESDGVTEVLVDFGTDWSKRPPFPAPAEPVAKPPPPKAPEPPKADLPAGAQPPDGAKEGPPKPKPAPAPAPVARQDPPKPESPKEDPTEGKKKLLSEAAAKVRDATPLFREVASVDPLPSEPAERKELLARAETAHRLLREARAIYLDAGTATDDPAILERRVTQIDSLLAALAKRMAILEEGLR